MLQLPVPDRLIGAVLDIWENDGQAAISARAVTQAADVQLSAIYHHFGDMERLLLAAQASALGEAKTWCAMQCAALSGLPLMPPRALAPVMAALIDDWTQRQRRSAFAWRYALLMAGRDPAFYPAATAWDELWGNFWQGACEKFDLPGCGAITSLFFDSECQLHLLDWRRPIDRACLDEMCLGWTEWMCGRLAPEGPWRSLAREAAGKTMPELPVRIGATAPIAAAAAAVLAEGGATSLTHRAVAAHAGVTLGVVSHKFRTRAELVRAAFEATYEQLTAGPHMAADGSVAPQTRSAVIAQASAPIDIARFLVMQELMLAVAQDPQWRDYAPQLRYSRGRSSGVVLRALMGAHRAISPLDAALFSGVMASVHRRATHCPASQGQALIGQAIDEILKRLDCDRSASSQVQSRVAGPESC